MFLHSQFKLVNLIQCGFLSLLKQQALINENNINQVLYQNRTPLHIAIINNQIQVAQYLLSFKPNIQAKDALGLRPLDYINLKNNKQVFQSILKYFGDNKQDISQIKIQRTKMNIWRAAQISVSQLQKYFKQNNQNNKTEKNKSPFIKDQFGRKALHYAAMSGNTQTFNYLIQHKFDPLYQDKFGLNAYHYMNMNPLNPLNKTKNKYLSNMLYQSKQDFYDVIIVGSGAAGIGAGVTLARNGVSNFIVLQARDRMGGRISTYKINQVQLDLAASWVHVSGKNNPITKQMNKLNCKQRKSKKGTDPLVLSTLKDNLSQQEIHYCLMLSQSYLELANLKAMSSKQDMSLQQAGRQYYEKHIQNLPQYKKSLVNAFIYMTEGYNAGSRSQLSAKYYDSGIQDGLDVLPQGGYCKLLHAIAQTVNLRQKVIFNRIVEEINYSKNQNQFSSIRTKDGAVYHAKKIISSLPLGILKSNLVKFIPQLPQMHQNSINKIGYGIMNKIIVHFQQPIWKQNPFMIRIATQVIGKFSFFYNYSTQNQHIMVCLITGNFAKSVTNQSDQQIISDLINVFKKVFQKQQIKIKNYYITKWEKDPFALGSYSHFGIDCDVQTVKNLRKNINQKLWFVGQHTYPQNIGCAHGAYQTGIWAAQQVIKCFKEFNLN